MTDASSDSDESAGRVQEWEVVSMSVLSMSGSAGNCACESCASAMPDDGTGSTVVNGPNAATLLSNHFGSARSLPMLDEFLGTGGDSRTGVEDGNDGRAELEGDTGKRPLGLEMETGQEPRPDVEEKEEVVADSQNFNLPEMDWIEPLPPKNHSLLRDEADATSSAYNDMYDIAGEKKPESDCIEEAAGPLFGSCMSTSSAAAVVSSVTAFRTGLGEDLMQSPIEGDESVMSANCFVEEELAGLEREVLGADSGFSSFHESPVVAKKLELDDSQEEERLLGEGAEDHACEAWWKRSAALWCVQTRQANTLWSLALAAAVMGLVILGQRWQHERCENNHLRLQLCSKDEKISQLIFQVARLKDALSGRRRVPVLRTSSSYSGFRERF